MLAEELDAQAERAVGVFLAIRLASLARERVIRVGILVDRDERVGREATFDEIERFYEHLEHALLRAGFLNPRSPKKLMERLRRLFGRIQLEQEEINILRGVIKTLAEPKKKR